MSLAQPYLISNLRTGVERDMEPWLLPEDAFPNLEDCYLFRGRIQRRRGFKSLGRLVTNIGSAIGAAFAGNVPNAPLQPGSILIIVGTITFRDDGNGILIGDPAVNTGTINYATGAIALNFNPVLGVATDVESVNFLPVMGLLTRELTNINEEQLIGFDTQKANVFSTFNNSFDDITFYKTSGTSFSWTGSNSDFFWGNNYLNAFWVTNGTKGFQDSATASTGSGDGIRWYDGTGWVNFLPAITGAVGVVGTTYLMGCRLIVNYRNRLVVLNTFEGTAFGSFTQFRQRARWSQNGTPYPAQDALLNASPVPSGFTGGTEDSAWRSDIAGRGGFIDAPTSEEIISAQFFKDTLIVFFERSTWQLRYTGNELLPFIWERINVELGAESTFSIVPFDAGMVAVGNYGIITCDSTGVKRIDQIIPDEVFNIHNGNDGVKRVYGIRDFTQQLIYWTFPSSDSNTTFPNRILLYNYLDGSYSFFNDSFTCFGTYQPFNDITWADIVQQWQGTPVPWNSGQFQSDYPLICAGNQQGFVFADINRGPTFNDPSIMINVITQANPAVITSINHNLSEGTIIQTQDIQGMSLTIVGEASGVANAGTTSFTGVLLLTPVLPGSVTITIGANVFTDDGIGNLIGGNGGTISYSTGAFSADFTVLAVNTNATSDYTQSLNNAIFRVSVPITANTFVIQTLDINGNFIDVDSTALSAYITGGLIKVKNNFVIESKRFNPFLKDGDQLRLQNVDFFIETNDNLEFTCTVFLDENDNTSIEQDAILPLSNFSGKVWIRTYFSVIGQFTQLQLSFDDEQMFNPTISDADVTVHAMMLWMSRAGRLTYGDIF